MQDGEVVRAEHPREPNEGGNQYALKDALRMHSGCTQHALKDALSVPSARTQHALRMYSACHQDVPFACGARLVTMVKWLDEG